MDRLDAIEREYESLLKREKKLIRLWRIRRILATLNGIVSLLVALISVTTIWMVIAWLIGWAFAMGMRI